MNAIVSEPMMPSGQDAMAITALEARVAHLEALLGEDYPAISLARILRDAATIFGVTIGQMKGETRHQRVARARFAVCWLAHAMLGYSSPRVGRSLGGRDHTSVLHACKQAITLRVSDPDFRDLTEQLRARVLKRNIA